MSRRRLVSAPSIAAIGFMLCAPLAAQWLNHPTGGLPRARDGKPNLSAPFRRTGDGKPDLSGVWEPAPDPEGRPGGIEGIVAPRYLIDITKDLRPSDVPFTPWAAALYRQRAANSRKDNPLARCLPAGVPRLDAYTHPYKIVQVPGLTLVLYEAATFRQIFTDGRDLPKDPEPSWMGYSIGRWEADVFVVDTNGFNDKTWLDGNGHPNSDAMHLTERFRRRNIGQMDIEIAIDDPLAYTKRLTYTQPQRLLPDTDLLEYVCNVNLKDLEHTGKD